VLSEYERPLESMFATCSLNGA